MKKLLFALLLAAPMLFTSCSKEETKVVPLIDNIEFDKRLAVTKSDLVKYQVIRNLNNNKYTYMVFRNSEAAILITDLAGTPENYLYCKQWDVSNGNLTLVSEKGVTNTLAISKEYKRSGGDSYTITVYLKDNTGEYAYDAVDDGGNSAIASRIWSVINNERNSKE